LYNNKTWEKVVNMKPEEKARQKIDRMLEAAGWQNRRNWGERLHPNR